MMHSSRGQTVYCGWKMANYLGYFFAIFLRHRDSNPMLITLENTPPLSPIGYHGWVADASTDLVRPLIMAQQSEVSVSC